MNETDCFGTGYTFSKFKKTDAENTFQEEAHFRPVSWTVWMGPIFHSLGMNVSPSSSQVTNEGAQPLPRGPGAHQLAHACSRSAKGAFLSLPLGVENTEALCRPVSWRRPGCMQASQSPKYLLYTQPLRGKMPSISSTDPGLPPSNPRC